MNKFITSLNKLPSSKIYSSLYAVIVFVLFTGCYSSDPPKPDEPEKPSLPSPNVEQTTTSINIFDNYIKLESSPADGFDFPVGDTDGKGRYTDQSTGKKYNGWNITTKFLEQDARRINSGEDWNGSGGDNTDLRQEAYSVANGRVIFAAKCENTIGNVLLIEHTFYENNEKFKIRSLYAHLQNIKVQPSEKVKRRQLIANIGQNLEKPSDSYLHLEFIRDTLSPTCQELSGNKDINRIKKHYVAPTDFIIKHRNLFVPQKEASLVLVNHENHKMRIYKDNQMQGEYEVSFGQSTGQKRIEGDNKTPKGMYFVIQKHQGEFDEPYGKYYGGYWIKLNYPNKFDAQRGIREKIITLQQEKQISLNWEKRAPTLENTALGGGIGFHGWIKEWEDDSTRQRSWGCVVMHIYDIKKLFEQIPIGSMVVIF